MGMLETFSVLVIVAVFALSLFLAMMTTRTMIRPLRLLSGAARRVAEGDFDVEMPERTTRDEIGIVTETFGQMLGSIRAYIQQVRESMEKEAQMKERELSMEAHLKEAQLKYLQAQINPHFLFNSLNAGAQLAMMEDAEQTGIFMERMADFFRYNVKKMDGDATLQEEIQAVDNYIYILNVRYAGDITYEKKIEADIENVRVPSMVLQPIVENAVQHGIHDMMESGKICLTVVREEDHLRISVEDNGAGMTKQEIARVMRGEAGQGAEDGNSTGIAMDNVMSRLRLYYNRENLLVIRSEGKGMGTEVTILLPLEEGEEGTCTEY